MLAHEGTRKTAFDGLTYRTELNVRHQSTSSSPNYFRIRFLLLIEAVILKNINAKMADSFTFITTALRVRVTDTNEPLGDNGDSFLSRKLNFLALHPFLYRFFYFY